MNAVDEKAIALDCFNMLRATNKSDRSARACQHSSEITSHSSSADHGNPGPPFVRHAVSKNSILSSRTKAKIPTIFICHPERSEGSPNARATFAVSGNFYQELTVIVSS
jgi:hypothetical protein